MLACFCRLEREGYEPCRRLDVEAVCVGGASEISGRTLGSSATASPKTTRAVPTTRVRPTPCDQFFSARKMSERAAIQRRRLPGRRSECHLRGVWSR